MPAKYPHVIKAETYAKSVINGEIPACKWVILAAQRHFSDKTKVQKKEFLYKFDRERAERVCLFGENLPHIKGKWDGKNITLEPWQCFVLCMLFGWVKKSNGKRRFRKADIKIPRKNGKSTLAAIIGLYLLVADGEAGAEVYSGATSEQQALEVFRPAKIMVARSADFQRHFGVVPNARSIAQLHTNSFFKPLIGKPGDGASPHGHIADEYHEHPTDEQVDTMSTGMGAREQPLQLIITTAGDNLAGPCYQEFEDAKRVLEGTIVNDSLFAIIYTIDPEDDWTEESVLRKANPNFNVSVDAEFLIAAQRSAIQTPRKQAVFKTKHLNVWVGAMDAFFNIQRWKSCKRQISIEEFAGRPCYVALDLASKIDLAALDILFELENDEISGARFASFTKYYLPEDRLFESGRDYYRGWADEGWLTLTDGEIIDFQRIEQDVLALSSVHQIKQAAYDPWQATQLATNLMKDGAPMIEYRQTLQNLTEPMKWLDALIRSGEIVHDGNPITEWCLANVVAYVDPNDNVRPKKTREENKIDGAVAKIMNLGLAINQQDQGESYTATHGVVIV